MLFKRNLRFELAQNLPKANPLGRRGCQLEKINIVLISAKFKFQYKNVSL